MTRSFIIAASVALAGSAHANPAEIVVTKGPTAHVSYADLDLRSAAGRHTLNGRIRRAASVVCSRAEAGPAVSMQVINCNRLAVESGVAQMNAIAGRAD